MSAQSAALYYTFLNAHASLGRIRSETARFSDDKTRFSERTDVEAVGIGVPHADPKTRLSAEKPRFSRLKGHDVSMK